MQVSISQYFDGYQPVIQNFGTIGKKDFISTKVIDIANLVPHQHTVDIDVVQAKQKGKHLTTIYVIEKDGINFIIDGHHTLIAKKLNGQKRVRVKYYKFN